MNFFSALWLLFVPGIAFAQQNRYLLHNNWQFKKTGTEKFFKAVVPGCVHTDLLANQLIPDPFYEINEEKTQWVNTTNWEYKTVFNLPASMLNKKQLELVFEGLDTYAAIYLNNKLLLETNNMFRQWKLDIKELAKEKNNILVVRFTAAQNVVDNLAKKNLPLRIPDNNRLYARKAQYQFGWDFAPKLTTCGIWKNVYFQTPEEIKIEQLTHRVTEKDPKKYKLSVHAQVFTNAKKTTTVYTELIPADQNNMDPLHRKKAMEENRKTDQILSGTSISLEAGWNTVTIPYTVLQPELWEPNGSGKQPMYHLDLLVDGVFETRKIGLRTIELVTKADSISDFPELRNKNGTGFYFKVNDKPVYIKGANYVPADMFPARVSKAKYRDILVAAKEANMNMLRVWGGGIYEDDYFYELSDSLGIMIWQDFMFAGSMLPTDADFAANVKQEATEQVLRLQHHPSIALWCGNNEIDEAWHNWGWQKQFDLSKEDSTKIWNAYRNIFHKILPDIVKAYQPEINYWPSSPSIGWGRKESLTSGDSHYWGVWWGLDSIEKYDIKIPRFMSEYGMQSMPSIQALKLFAKDADWDSANPVIKNHQKHPTGFQNLKVYLDRLFVKDKYMEMLKANTQKEKFEYFVYLTQVLQAEAYKKAITAHRKNMPYNMGTMLWQLNDPWPVASWSIIDYYGNKKPAYYQVKASYEPVLLTTRKLNDTTIYCSVINESQQDFSKIDINMVLLDSFQNPDAFKDSSISLPPFSVKNIQIHFDTTSQQKNNTIKYYLTREIKEKDSFVYYNTDHDQFTPYEPSYFLSSAQPKLTPVFNWVKNKLMVTGVRIKKRYTYYEPLALGFFYHPLIKNIVHNNYQYYYIDRGQSEKIELIRPISEKEFAEIRFFCINYNPVF